MVKTEVRVVIDVPDGMSLEEALFNYALRQYEVQVMTAVLLRKEYEKRTALKREADARIASRKIS